ncbi:MAG: hypothetical protein ACFCVG_06910 [Kineosporiaceae bacterium]
MRTRGTASRSRVAIAATGLVLADTVPATTVLDLTVQEVQTLVTDTP